MNNPYVFWRFDDSPLYVGEFDGLWNGWTSVRVTPRTHAFLMREDGPKDLNAERLKEYDDEHGALDVHNPPRGDDGLIDLNGYVSWEEKDFSVRNLLELAVYAMGAIYLERPDADGRDREFWDYLDMVGLISVGDKTPLFHDCWEHEEFRPLGIWEDWAEKATELELIAEATKRSLRYLVSLLPSHAFFSDILREVKRAENGLRFPGHRDSANYIMTFLGELREHVMQGFRETDKLPSETCRYATPASIKQPMEFLVDAQRIENVWMIVEAPSAELAAQIARACDESEWSFEDGEKRAIRILAVDPQ